MRTLYYVPMIHVDAELNEVGPIIKDLRTRIYGEQAVAQDESAILDLWRQIKDWVRNVVNDPQGLIIYQDGIPIGPREKIRQLFALILQDHPHSPLFRIIKELLNHGAILEGTEDFSLLIQRVAVYKEIYQAAKKCQNLHDAETSIIKKVEELDGLIVQSDEMVAKRIDKTLRENERGILFMGHRHEVDNVLMRKQNAGLLSFPIRIVKLGVHINKSTELSAPEREEKQ